MYVCTYVCVCIGCEGEGKGRGKGRGCIDYVLNKLYKNQKKKKKHQAKISLIPLILFNE